MPSFSPWEKLDVVRDAFHAAAALVKQDLLAIGATTPVEKVYWTTMVIRAGRKGHADEVLSGCRRRRQRQPRLQWRQRL